ncbi:hypothetical protein BGX28_008172, partial [Mortierella sp. GBA30]
NCVCEDDTENEGEEEDEEGKIWSVQDIYHGLAPAQLVRDWKRLFETTKEVALCMAAKFIGRLEEYGRTEIWGKRCNITVEWEQKEGITSQMKRAKGNSQFVAPQGTRMEVDLRDADTQAMAHYHGRKYMSVMERLGGLKTALLAMSHDP